MTRGTLSGCRSDSETTTGGSVVKLRMLELPARIQNATVRTVVRALRSIPLYGWPPNADRLRRLNARNGGAVPVGPRAMAKGRRGDFTHLHRVASELLQLVQLWALPRLNPRTAHNALFRLLATEVATMRVVV